MQTLETAVPERTCGSCTLCCKVMEITELNKPVGKWCHHCKPGTGCKIYDARPRECRTFNCMWLIDERLHAGWKPSNSKMVLTTGDAGNSVEIRCDPGFPSAWRSAPFHDEIRNIARAAEQHDGSLYVIVGKRSTLITPDSEFDLGEVLPDERIVREIRGTKTVGVRVIKAADVDKL
jgi:hypothetical protein